MASALFVFGLGSGPGFGFGVDDGVDFWFAQVSCVVLDLFVGQCVFCDRSMSMVGFGLPTVCSKARFVFSGF